MILDLFPTAIGIYDLSEIELDPIINDLKNIPIKEHSLVSNGTSSWYTNFPNNSYILKRKLLTPLLGKFKDCLDNYCMTTGIPEVIITNSWHNYMPTGGKTTRHRHENSTVSGAFYVQAEKGSCPFLVHSPLRPYKMTQINNQETQYNSELAAIDSVTGRLVLFPSWLEHETTENKSNNERIVISFNTTLKSILDELVKVD